MNQQRGTWYHEMNDLYERFVEGCLTRHFTSYFTELRKYFEEGSELITRIHALELILNIILGGKWCGVGSRPKPLFYPDFKRGDEYEINWDGYIEAEEMVLWLEQVLPNEKEKDVIKTYFIFIKTHWEYLYKENFYFVRLYNLHKILLHMKIYGKLELMEQLHKNAFTEGYRILR